MWSSAVHASPATSPSPWAVHALVCEFVTAQAEAEKGHGGGWVGYRDVFLSAEVQDLIRLRLQDEEGATAVDVAGDGAPTKKKKRKLDVAPAAAAADSDVSWTICSMDGATLSVAVPEDAPVAELKRAIGVLREVPCFTIELFMKDVEEALADETPLRSLGRVPLFLLLKQASDRLALESFFKSTGGVDWYEKEDWMTDAELGDWYGVTVDEEGRVTKLMLGNNGLAGPLPSDIQQLSALEVLELGSNALTGPIPAELGQLGALTGLFLDDNELSGPIPAELVQLRALTGLWLNGNQLSGPVPATLGQLAALQFLNLSHNELSGPIPAELGQLAALEYLFLDENQQLTGQEALRGYMAEHSPGCHLEL